MGALASDQWLDCSGFFEHDFLCLFVFTEPKKDGLAQTLVASQFAKFDLTYQTRFHPMAKPHFRSGNALAPFASTRKGQIYKRTRRAFYLLESGIELSKKSRAKTRTDSSHKY